MSELQIIGGNAAEISERTSNTITDALNEAAKDHNRQVAAVRYVPSTTVEIAETAEREMIAVVRFNENGEMPRPRTVEAVLRVKGMGEDQEVTYLRLCRTPNDQYSVSGAPLISAPQLA